MFACQQDSYAQTLKSVVKQCNAVKFDGGDAYEVLLEDTVLFPEGGGQPDDRGTINGVPVIRVTRRGAEAVHITRSPLEVGADADIVVDWQRRFDNMQQHSGQHLITALADSKWNYKTTSWNLGESKSHLELDCKNLPVEQIDELERMVNDAILACKPMTPRLVEPGSDELNEIRSRGLPADHVGPVRVVEIQGIDSNMCCGTHVSNISHLQAIKLLHTEPKRGHTLLFYVAGQRALSLLQRCVETERQLTRLLSCGPEEHPQCVDRILKSQKVSAKTLRNQLVEIAELLVAKHLAESPLKPVMSVHREDGDMPFMNALASGLDGKDVVLFVTCGPEKGPGSFMLAGPAEKVSAVSSQIATLLDAKGGGRGSRYQGKAKSFAKRADAEALLF